jgi:hypothetical protein
MKKSAGPKDDFRSWCRERLELVARLLARTGPAHRRQLVSGIRSSSGPEVQRLLAELLVKKLGYKDPRAGLGAADALELLGPVVAPVLKLAVLRKPTDLQLLRMARVLAAVGAQLADAERHDLMLAALMAAVRAKNAVAGGALYEAVARMRDVAHPESATSSNR